MDTTFDTIRRLAVDTLEVPEAALLRAHHTQRGGIAPGDAGLVFAIEAHYGLAINAEDPTA